MKSKKIYNKIIKFLLKKHWAHIAITDKYDIYAPPAALGFSKEYKFYLLNNTNDKFYSKNIETQIKILNDIYPDMNYTDTLECKK